MTMRSFFFPFMNGLFIGSPSYSKAIFIRNSFQNLNFSSRAMLDIYENCIAVLKLETHACALFMELELQTAIVSFFLLFFIAQLHI
jgi:hypothetical protein